MNKKSIKEAIKTLEEFNEWRREEAWPSKLKLPDPTKVGKAIDLLIKVAKSHD